MTPSTQDTSEVATNSIAAVTIDTIDPSLDNPVLGRVVISRVSGIPVTADLKAGDTVEISKKTEV